MQSISGGFNQCEGSSTPFLGSTSSSSAVIMDIGMAPNVSAPSTSNDASERVENLDKEQESQDHVEEVNPDPFAPKKRLKKSGVWEEFREIEVNSVTKAECMHCKVCLTISKSKQTTSFRRHLQICVVRIANQRNAQQQTLLNFQPASCASFQLALISTKFDMGRMREAAAHWILIHEHPFTILEGLNMMLKLGMPEWKKI